MNPLDLDPTAQLTNFKLQWKVDALDKAAALEAYLNQISELGYEIINICQSKEGTLIISCKIVSKGNTNSIANN